MGFLRGDGGNQWLFYFESIHDNVRELITVTEYIYS